MCGLRHPSQGGGEALFAQVHGESSEPHPYPGGDKGEDIVDQGKYGHELSSDFGVSMQMQC